MWYGYCSPFRYWSWWKWKRKIGKVLEIEDANQNSNFRNNKYLKNWLTMLNIQVGPGMLWEACFRVNKDSPSSAEISWCDLVCSNSDQPEELPNVETMITISWPIPKQFRQFHLKLLWIFYSFPNPYFKGERNLLFRQLISYCVCSLASVT